jgi:O-antigen/teichoic acid export membrane protein
MNIFNRQQISRNVLATILQVLVTGILYFILYRFLLVHLGVSQLGIWSLVLATTSVSRIGEFGLSAGVVRFVAHALGQGNSRRAGDIVQTVAVTLGVLMAILLLACFPLFAAMLKYLLPEQSVQAGMDILPYALLSLWTMVIASVFMGGLDACQRIDLRSVLSALFNFAYLGLTVLWVPAYGLKGVAIAQLVQSIGLVLASWWLLRRQITSLPLLPLTWRLQLLKEMIGYGVNFQIISIMSMLFDPITKGLMSKLGGLEALGYYEMANKLILQARGLIVETNRVVVPMVSALHDYDPQQVVKLFITSYQVVFFISILFYSCIAIGIPSISFLWIGNYQPMFVQFSLLLILGWCVNTLIGPAFFSNLGTGNLRKNVISQTIIGVGGFFGGLLLGYVAGGVGVVLGSILGLIAGSFFLLITYIRRSGLIWTQVIIPSEMGHLILLCLAGTGLANYGSYTHQSFPFVLIIGCVCIVIMLLLGWRHPMTRKLIGWSRG